MSEKKIIPLDYSKVENWLINANADLSKSYDLLFFFGTSISEADRKNGVGYVCDDMRIMGYQNYMMCGSQLAEDARVFVPMQRQMALEYALSEYISHKDIIEDISRKAPYVDLEAALDFYFENYNKNAIRPFVMAGHSQGAAALQVCIKKYFLTSDKKDYLKNMIAAYSYGYGVSQTLFDSLPDKEGRIHFAEGEDDFNCLISWNTEGVGEKGPSFLLADEGDTTLVINPINWKRDETYAGISENKGVQIKEVDPNSPIPQYHLSLLNKDLCDAQIDLKRGSVICSTCTDYCEGIWGGKSLHVWDGPAYYNNVKDNLRLRVANFFKSKINNGTV